MKYVGNKEYAADVVVIGAGPGGSTAAKNCAQLGLRTLLLEKAKPPRYKSCLRRFPDNLTRTLIAREYGPIPDWVLTDPPYIYYLARGMWPTPFGKEPVEEPQLCPHMSSTESDYWMNLKAKAAGVEIWDETLATNVIQEGEGVVVSIRRRGKIEEIRARFVIGADGAMSTTRRSLYPDLVVPTVANLQEFYPGVLGSLDRNYAYTFEFDPPQKDALHVVHRRGCFHIDVNGLERPVRESMRLAKQTLAKMFGFDPDTKPQWSAGTTTTFLLGDLLSGKLIPARGNVLLVGEAASLEKPSDVGMVGGVKRWFGGGGIGLAVKSGILAADAVVKAAASSREAAGFYLPEFEKVISVLNSMASAPAIYRKGNWRGHDKLLDQLL